MNIKPSNHFKGMVRILGESMMFKHGKVGGVFFWLFCWLMPACILGWFIADIFVGDD